MTTYHRIDATPPPVGVPCRVWWLGEGEITATWDGPQWRDAQGRSGATRRAASCASDSVSGGRGE